MNMDSGIEQSSSPNNPNLWQRWGNFLESHPRFFKATMVGAAAVGAVALGLDVADVIIDKQIDLLNVEVAPVDAWVTAMGVLGARHVQRNYL
jgi:hypothetical protein